ncbi:MAG: endonuclease/exonuclease/phosphatase family protein, partial [Cetobacterium sp.]
MGIRNKHHIRVGNINLNNTLQNPEGDERLFREIYSRDINILCMQEVGCNWTNIHRNQTLQQRLNNTFGPQETKASCMHNRHDLSGSKNQWGGTGVMCKGKIKHYAIGAGGDPSGLGRWTWARIQGKRGLILRYVSVYCPCENRSGTISVWAQQKTYLQNKNDDRDPRKAFLEDLAKELEEWKNIGDQILLCGDLNHDISSRKIQSFFDQFHMTNLIYNKHGSAEAPSTYYLNEEGKSVDGIWGTPGLKASQCGYLRPTDFPGDHALLWVDISYQAALGHSPPQPKTPAARRLQLYDKRCVKRYLDSYQTQIELHQLPKRQFALERATRPNVPLTPIQAQEAEAIDHL